MPKALLNRIAELALAVAVLALLAVGAFSLRGLSLAGASERWVGHTHEVLEGLQGLLVATQRVESSFWVSSGTMGSRSAVSRKTISAASDSD